jgi:hypothetical protein
LFAGATLARVDGESRCSAFVAIDALDFGVVAEGFAVAVRSDKTDQDGRGCTIESPSSSSAELCDVRSVLAWLNVADVPEGPFFAPHSPRRHAVQALAHLGDAALTPVRAPLADEDEGVRGEAVLAAHLGPKAEAVLPALIAALRDPMPAVRRNSVMRRGR